MKIPERPIVPLLSYSNPKVPKEWQEHHDLRGVELGDDRHTAVWGLWQYTTSDDRPHVVEARVLFGTWYNFCGGGRFFSPQVLMRRNSDIGWHGDPAYAWPAGFGGRTFRGHQPSFREHFTTAKRFIPSLNEVLEEKYLSHTQAETIMWDSLAHGALGYMTRNGRCFWVGADKEGGYLEQFVKVMQERQKMVGYVSPIHVPVAPHSDTLTKKRFLANAYVGRGLACYPHEVTKAEATNWNSGNTCAIYTLTLSCKGGINNSYFYTDEGNLYRFMAINNLEDCPACNSVCSLFVRDDKIICDNCNHEVIVPRTKSAMLNKEENTFFYNTLEYALAKMASPTYLDHIPYALWGN